MTRARGRDKHRSGDAWRAHPDFRDTGGVNERFSRNLRNMGVAIVLGAFAIDAISRRTNPARIATDAARRRATRWLQEPGAGVAILGEALVQLGKLSSGEPASPPSLDEG
jgi:hypothetical protein